MLEFVSNLRSERHLDRTNLETSHNSSLLELRVRVKRTMILFRRTGGRKLFWEISIRAAGSGFQSIRSRIRFSQSITPLLFSLSTGASRPFQSRPFL